MKKQYKQQYKILLLAFIWLISVIFNIVYLILLFINRDLKYLYMWIFIFAIHLLIVRQFNKHNNNFKNNL